MKDYKIETTRYYLESSTLEELLGEVEYLCQEYGYTAKFTFWEGETISIDYWVELTPQEKERQKKAEEKEKQKKLANKQKQKQKELKEYQRLKKKFGDKG